ncbi:hypothetical protein DPMN_027788 [Dreissena polymorpha]|uniref:Uncharacterized protein n=1 Tax=Dreissena polymorpha TaxID=45954 RepID=A0A9D4LVZ5_DREPO|nr:hypothetical protein DPMN_027788 [Dreissena polymorpha]
MSRPGTLRELVSTLHRRSWPCRLVYSWWRWEECWITYNRTLSTSAWACSTRVGDNWLPGNDSGHFSYT